MFADSAPARPRAQPSDVYVIAGWLGSGKTTLLRRVLAHLVAKGVRPGVLMNEFGETDLDGDAARADAEVAERVQLRTILAGCVCCEVTDRFGEQLLDLAEDVNGAPIVVETTGLAEPGQVANAVDHALAGAGHLARLARVIVVLDASRLSRADTSWDASRHHLRRADTIILNKIDRATAAEIGEASRRADRDAPGAKLMHAMYADVPVARLLRRARRRAVTVQHAEVNSTAGFRSVTCGVLGRLDVTRFQDLLDRHAKTLARVKGVVRTSPDGAWEELQWTDGAVERRPWTVAPGRREESRLVLIGRRVPWERVLRRLSKCVVRARKAARTRRSPPRPGR